MLEGSKDLPVEIDLSFWGLFNCLKVSSCLKARQQQLLEEKKQMRELFRSDSSAAVNLCAQSMRYSLQMHEQCYQGWMTATYLRAAMAKLTEVN